MFDNQDSTEVKSIKFSHFISNQLVSYCRYEEDAEIPVMGEKFSPLPGWIFQLEITKLDEKSFWVCLKNLSEENVDILTLSISSAQNRRMSMNNLSLRPRERHWVATFKFYVVSGFEMEIEAKIQGEFETSILICYCYEKSFIFT